MKNENVLIYIPIKQRGANIRGARSIYNLISGPICNNITFIERGGDARTRA